VLNEDVDEPNSLLDDIIPDKVLDSFTSFASEVNMKPVSTADIVQLETPSGIESVDGGGAFKFYTTFADELLADMDNADDEDENQNDISISYDDVLNKLNFKINELAEESQLAPTATEQQVAKPSTKSTGKSVPKSPSKLGQDKSSSPQKTTSPFVSIENRQKGDKPKTPSKIPLKDGNFNKPRPATSLGKKEPSAKVQRPASTYYDDSKYLLDSDDMSFVDDMNLEMKLKEEQKKRKMTDELLDQLQISYNQLLEKHALAENFIDTLRLGAKLQVHEEVVPAIQRV
jgi:hypothetical protein